ncbi:MAG TPA: AAA family ATPase [Candidatus Mediterraneibacter norfolkensis]|nr:AAA family ATPase [Candidatus Mediterraneibacter norfolkensis]
MRIRELYLKNFGKFSEKHFYMKDGVQVVYGENEFGKSTLHAFIRAMLFGMERGRGRAAGKDAFSRFEPWENPGYYAGVMRFECGGRNFRLERSFDRISKHVSLVCEDDGEELSVEHGDLEMLLGGITPAEFDSTVSVGQLMARPGEELAESLKNYAANYYETGGGEVDLSGALDELRERRKEVERGLKEEERIQDEKRKTLAQERAYLERDLNKLREEYEEKCSAARRAAREKEKRAGQKPPYQRKEVERTPERTWEASKHSRGYERNQNISGKGTDTGIRIPAGVICLILGTLGILAGLVMNKKSFAVSAATGVIPVLLLIAGVLLLMSGIQRIRRAKTEQWNDGEEEREDGGEDSILRELERQEERLRWEMSRIRAEWQDKQVRAENLREQEEEFTRSDTEKNLLRRRRALLLAEEKIRSAAEELGQQTSQLLNRRASEIFAELTAEKYRGIEADDRLEITVWDGERRIPAERLSRGTLEQIYFSVRMAAAELLQEEPMPLIFDDTFAFYDDKRLESALKWLSRQDRQVIIFTCQRREGEMLHEDRTAKKGIDDHQ